MSTAAQNSDIKSLELAELGKKRIEWANQSMKAVSYTHLPRSGNRMFTAQPAPMAMTARVWHWPLGSLQVYICRVPPPNNITQAAMYL